MNVVYQYCKMQVRRSKKRILSDEVDAAWPQADAMEDLLMAATKCAIKQPGGRLTSAPLPPPAPVSAAGTKRYGGGPEPPPAKQVRNGEASQSKRQENSMFKRKAKFLDEQEFHNDVWANSRP